MSQKIRRGPWQELELVGDVDADTDVRLLFCPGWTNDRETLTLPLRETGWFDTSTDAYAAMTRAELTWTWVGVDDNLDLRECTSEGLSLSNDELLEEVVQVTIARLRSLG